MICNKCGTNNSSEAKFCERCGASLEEAKQPPYHSQQSYSNTVGTEFDYTPITMWGYFLYEILFSIPCVGFILLLVFSFGGTKNINVRNFARSYFCYLILLAVLGMIVVSIIGISLNEFMR